MQNKIFVKKMTMYSLLEKTLTYCIRIFEYQQSQFPSEFQNVFGLKFFKAGIE